MNGVHISIKQVERILSSSNLFLPFLPESRKNPDLWFTPETFVDTDHPSHLLSRRTQTTPDPFFPGGHACVFRTDQFCALQLASQENGEDPWSYKPFYCALYPLDFIKTVLTLANPGFACSIFHSKTTAVLYRLFPKEILLVLDESGLSHLDELASQEGPTTALNSQLGS